MFPFTRAFLDSGMTYAAYTQLVEKLLAQGQTTGPDQSEGMVAYTRLNATRTRRVWDKFEMSPALQQVLRQGAEDLVLVAITEAWCGDAAQNLPVFGRLAEAFPLLELRIFLRDEHPQLMDHYLTGGTSRSIPVIVVLRQEANGQFTQLGWWGPRPQVAQDMLLEYKKNPTKPKEAFYEDLHRWYAADNSQTLQAEWAQLLTQWLATPAEVQV